MQPFFGRAYPFLSLFTFPDIHNNNVSTLKKRVEGEGGMGGGVRLCVLGGGEVGKRKRTGSFGQKKQQSCRGKSPMETTISLTY